ncbi:MAG: deoxyribonuclease IV [bacterium]
MGLIIGSHVSMSGRDMLLGSVKEALSYEANTFMFYTGAPQNTRRKKVSELRVDEAKALMASSGIAIDDVIVHAPYIINLGNTIKPETRELALTFLREEITRCEAIGMKTLVLHPGSHVKAGVEVGIDAVVAGLNEILRPDQQVQIALETMAGKGSELGSTLEELTYIIDHVHLSHLLGVCLDTCHLNDAGYDVADFDAILDRCDQLFGIERIRAVHVNDSKNIRGARKDRHENIGHGTIGFTALNQVVHNERLASVPKILETPYIDQKAPYKEEIAMLRAQAFTPLK